LKNILNPAIFALMNAWCYLRHAKLVWWHHRRLDYWPNVAHPQTYCERMLWRKILDHNPLFVTSADKLLAKDYVQARCPDLNLPETLWVGTDADNIPAEALRGDVFIKATHGCNFNLQLHDSTVNRTELKHLTDAWLHEDYSEKLGEWAYSAVEPRLMVETSIANAEHPLLDFQMRAAKGTCLLGSVTGHNKTSRQWLAYLDKHGNPIPGLGYGDFNAGNDPVTTSQAFRDQYQKVIRLSELLSQDFDYARFDFLWNGLELYGGEITIYPGAGLAEIGDPTVRKIIMEGWSLLDTHLLTAPQPWPLSIYANALKRTLEPQATHAS
jgi:hypothetical protein